MLRERENEIDISSRKKNFEISPLRRDSSALLSSHWVEEEEEEDIGWCKSAWMEQEREFRPPKFTPSGNDRNNEGRSLFLSLLNPESTAQPLPFIPVIRVND